MQIPVSLEQEIREAVTSHLETELTRRRLVLTSAEVAAANLDAAQLGARLLSAVVDLCYPRDAADGPAAVEFDSGQTADRLQAALAFGAISARVLSPATGARARPSETIELLSAVFNVGIGLIDALCDQDPVVGIRLLDLFCKNDLEMAARTEPPHHWLRAKLPPALARDEAVSFTADIVEGFFAALHAVYPRGAGLRVRRDVAAQLTRALDAERLSVGGSSSDTRERLLECSRLTSVLPFEIIETLVRAGDRRGRQTPGTQLGEAMWRIDDLVDVCDDARCGALNSLLINDDRAPWPPNDEQAVLDALERLLTSSDLADGAQAAAESLLSGLGPDHRLSGQQRRGETLAFLGFIQDYADIPPHAVS
jgi:hypothetical protein